MEVIGVLAGTRGREVVHFARLGIEADDTVHIAVLRRGHLALELAGAQVVQIQLAQRGGGAALGPGHADALRVPEELVAFWQVAKIAAALAALVLGGGGLLVHVAHRAGRGIGNAEVLVFVVARGGDEGKMAAVFAPLHVLVRAPSEVVRGGRAMLIRRHLQADHAGGLSADGKINDDALNGGDDLIAWKRINLGGQGGMADHHRNQVELADAALVLLESGDLGRVRRPEYDGAVARGPAGVVGGVAEILDAVAGELRFLVGAEVAHPQVPVLDEHGAFAVRRNRLRRLAIAAAAAAGAAPAAAAELGRSWIVVGRAARALAIALPAAASGIERDRASV